MAHVVTPNTGVRPEKGGFVVYINGCRYGRYRTRAMAEAKVEQVALSRMPVKQREPAHAERRRFA